MVIRGKSGSVYRIVDDERGCLIWVMIPPTRGFIPLRSDLEACSREQAEQLIQAIEHRIEADARDESNPDLKHF